MNNKYIKNRHLIENKNIYKSIHEPLPKVMADLWNRKKNVMYSSYLDDVYGGCILCVNVPGIAIHNSKVPIIKYLTKIVPRMA